MSEITAYTDGACSGNPGPGGWGVVLRAKSHKELIKEKLLSGGAGETTNNRMELTAAIEALKALKIPTQITIYTDSTYVRDGLTKWIAKWKKNGWKSSNKKPIKNEDLWKTLELENRKHRVNWEWVKGHNGHEGNELADKLATDEVNKRKHTSPISDQGKY